MYRIIVQYRSILCDFRDSSATYTIYCKVCLTNYIVLYYTRPYRQFCSMLNFLQYSTSTYFYNASGTVDYVVEETFNLLDNAIFIFLLIALFFIGYKTAIWFIKLINTKNDA